MIGRFLSVLLIFIMTTIPVSAEKIGGVNLPETLTAGGENLVLNGAGLRKKLWVKVYAGALYLKEKSDDAQKIIEAEEPMTIRLHFIREGVDSKKLVDAWNEGFESSTGGNMEPLQSEINRFNACFNQETKENDVYDLMYIPGQGVNVVIEGALKDTIKGLEFKKALFGIWLGENTGLKDLRKEMLGK